jgi:hypothetical protein
MKNRVLKNKEDRIHEMAVAWVCPISLQPKTDYEINEIKKFESFGRNVLAEFSKPYREKLNTKSTVSASNEE